MKEEGRILQFACERFPGARKMTSDALSALIFGVHGRNVWHERLIELEAEGADILKGDPVMLEAARAAWQSIEEDIHNRGLQPVPGRPRSDRRRKSFEIAHEQGIARRVLLAGIACGQDAKQASCAARSAIMLDGLDILWARQRKRAGVDVSLETMFQARCSLFILASAGRPHDEIERRITKDFDFVSLQKASEGRADIAP